MKGRVVTIKRVALPGTVRGCADLEGGIIFLNGNLSEADQADALRHEIMHFLFSHDSREGTAEDLENEIRN